MQGFSQIDDRKNCEDGEGDDFLDGFEFGGGEIAVADAVGGDLKAIFEEGDSPTDDDHQV